MPNDEVICPICGGPLMESRGKLVCPSNDHPRYEETCCEGGCSCGAVEGADWEDPDADG